MARVATSADAEGVAATLAAAFEHDPVWGWALPDPAAMVTWWGFLVRSALRYPHVWVEGDYDAVAVWIPPGGEELTAEEGERVEPLVRELAGARAEAMLELLERFEEAHPQRGPHYYLSLLGVHPRRRGRGIGMRLVAENLAHMDAAGIPAYLESTNPEANRRRYERAGFERFAEFAGPEGLVIEQMWRPPGGGDQSGRSPIQ